MNVRSTCSMASVNIRPFSARKEYPIGSNYEKQISSFYLRVVLEARLPKGRLKAAGQLKLSPSREEQQSLSELITGLWGLPMASQQESGAAYNLLDALNLWCSRSMEKKTSCLYEFTGASLRHTAAGMAHSLCSGPWPVWSDRNSSFAEAKHHQHRQPEILSWHIIPPTSWFFCSCYSKWLPVHTVLISPIQSQIYCRVDAFWDWTLILWTDSLIQFIWLRRRECHCR